VNARIDLWNFSLKDAPVAGLEPVEVNGFYGYMSDLGLRYGESFVPSASSRRAEANPGPREVVRSVRPPRRRVCAAPGAARWALKPSPRRRHDRRSSFADEAARAFLTHRVPPFPGPPSRPDGVFDHSDDFVEGRLSLYNDAGEPCVLVDGFPRDRRFRHAPVQRPGWDARCRLIVGWKRTRRLTRRSRRPRCREAVALRRRQGAGLALLQSRPRSAASGHGREVTISVPSNWRWPAGDGRRGGTPFTMTSLRIARRCSRPSSGCFPASRCAASSRRAKRMPTCDSGFSKAPSPPRKRYGRSSKDTRALARGAARHGELRRARPHSPGREGCRAGALLSVPARNSSISFTATASTRAAGSGRSRRRSRKRRGICRKGRGLRILEVGGGTAGLAAHVLPLLEPGLHSYTFTDVSAGFFPSALAKARRLPRGGVQDIRPRKARHEQELAAGSFDFIIGTNVIHAVRDIRVTLGHLRDLLAPGGSLVFMDTATPCSGRTPSSDSPAVWWETDRRDCGRTSPCWNVPNGNASSRKWFSGGMTAGIEDFVATGLPPFTASNAICLAAVGR